jgi:hypothetical protein
LATGRVNDSFSSLEKADEKIVNTAETEPLFTVTDAADDRERAVIADGLAGYNYDKVGYRDSSGFFCPQRVAATGSAAASSRWRKKKREGAAVPAPRCSR